MRKKLLCLFALLLSLAEFHSADYYIGQEADSSVLLAKAAKKTSKKKSKKGESSEEEIIGDVTAINIDKNRDKDGAGYFSGINKSVLEQVENGSAESLLQAYGSLKKAAVDYAENERWRSNTAIRPRAATS